MCHPAVTAGMTGLAQASLGAVPLVQVWGLADAWAMPAVHGAGSSCQAAKLVQLQRVTGPQTPPASHLPPRACILAACCMLGTVTGTLAAYLTCTKKKKFAQGLPSLGPA